MYTKYPYTLIHRLAQSLIGKLIKVIASLVSHGTECLCSPRAMAKFFGFSYCQPYITENSAPAQSWVSHRVLCLFMSMHHCPTLHYLLIVIPSISNQTHLSISTMLSVTRSLYHSLLCINEMLYSTITAVFHDLVKLKANQNDLFVSHEISQSCDFVWRKWGIDQICGARGSRPVIGILLHVMMRIMMALRHRGNVCIEVYTLTVLGKLFPTGQHMMGAGDASVQVLVLCPMYGVHMNVCLHFTGVHAP